MTFEDAASTVHQLSETLAKIVELQGDQAMAALGGADYKILAKQIKVLSDEAGDLIWDLSDGGGFDKIHETLDIEEVM